MKRIWAWKCTALVVTLAMVLASATILIAAIDAAQAAIDAQPVSGSTEKWSGTQFDAATAEITPVLYQVNASPVDLSLARQDVPDLMAYLDSSAYSAVYLDETLALRISDAGAVQYSADMGVSWTDAVCETASSEAFLAWMAQYHPNPGYSLEALEARLQEGASVRYLELENGTALYLIQDEAWLLLEFAQPAPEDVILLDGERMCFTFSKAYRLSLEKLRAFTGLLVSCEILPEDAAEDVLSQQTAWLGEKAFIELT